MQYSLDGGVGVEGEKLNKRRKNKGSREGTLKPRGLVRLD